MDDKSVGLKLPVTSLEKEKEAGIAYNSMVQMLKDGYGAREGETPEMLKDRLGPEKYASLVTVLDDFYRFQNSMSDQGKDKEKKDRLKESPISKFAAQYSEGIINVNETPSPIKTPRERRRLDKAFR